MILVLRTDATPPQIDHVIERVQELGFEPRVITGAFRTIVALIAYEALRYPYARSWIRSHRGAFTTEEIRQIAPTRGRVPDDQPE